MRIHLLDDGMEFPPVADAGEEGLLAIGGDLSPARLLAAYEHGVFPWFMEEDPIMWWSPPVRAMLPLDALRVSKSMRNVLNQKRFRVTMDQDFEGVIRGCQRAPRDGEGTWISDEVVEAYLKLHELGSAHSVEVWQGDALVGGLYGVSIGRMFFGESMFSSASNASKVALIHLVGWLRAKGFGPLDCQIMNPHLESLGAELWSREAYQEALQRCLHADVTLMGPWHLEVK